MADFWRLVSCTKLPASFAPDLSVVSLIMFKGGFNVDGAGRK